MKYINLDYYGRQKDSFYFALEKYLLTLEDDYCFLWKVYPAVIIGKHQIVSQEVNERALTEDNIGIFRRPSGGGAVYSDEGCIKYTFISKKMNKDELYFSSLLKIKNFLKTLGLNVEFSGRNDLLINGYKFSGNAYYQTKLGKVLHGTILFDTDLEKMSKVLTPTTEKLSSKGVKSVKSRVVNLSKLIRLTRHEFVYLFERFLNDHEIVLTNDEYKIIINYQKEFESIDYIYQDKLNYKIIKSKRFKFGEVIVNYNLENDTIKEIRILGDFFEKNPIIELEEKLLGFNLKAEKLPISIGNYIENMNNIQFLNLLKGTDKYE